MPELWQLEEEQRKRREEELQGELARAQNQLRQLSTQVAQLTASLEETRRALAAKEEELRALQAQSMAKEEALRQAQEGKAALAAAYQKALAEKTSLEREKAEAEATVARLRGELRSLREDAFTWQKKASDLECQKEAAKKQAAELREYLAKVMKSLQEHEKNAFLADILAFAVLIVAGFLLWDIWWEHRRKIQDQVHTPSAWGGQGSAQAFGIR